MITRLDWEFPLPRTHTGILQGNATTGTMIWGEGDHLKITIGRSDFWDHRGGMPWTERQNYKDIRACLEANDEPGLRALFKTSTEDTVGQPPRPSVLPVGRVDLKLGDGAVLTTGVLDMSTGSAAINYEQDGETKTLTIHLSMTDQVIGIEFAPGTAPELVSIPSWEFKGEYLEQISFEKPLPVNQDGMSGWVQPLPVDPNLAIVHKVTGDCALIAATRSDSIDTSIELAKKALDTSVAAIAAGNANWWASYWKDVPRIDIPNDELVELYCYGMYKFACFTQPDGVAAGLQGPWVEEYELPPWSNDYHFNINVQMCYWPAYKGNKLSHLKPLFNLVLSWEDKLRHNARAFLGIDDGLMLPHAVDDDCVCMGGFWTGCIDHACTAWVAQMMYDYARYSCDSEFLKEKAFPFMKGTMRVYEEMLERDGDSFVLPVSVSPEYRGASMNAWGANASFQLACMHRLCENLMDTAKRIGESPAPIWQEILDKLPKVCLTDDGKRIGLWQGVDLEESHRHHSHLGAICPFDTIDIYSEEWQPKVAESLNHWIAMGMGRWSGWCVPWASMLHSRTGNGEMAELILEMWNRVYTNEGRGTLHDCDMAGLTVMGGPRFGEVKGSRRELMQLDAGMGAVVAIQDMVMHSRRGVVHVFPAIPDRWKACSFGPMPCEGGFYISATRQAGKTTEVTITATHDETLKIADPWTGEVLELSMKAGEEKVLRP